jgi:hypothetical protein
MGIPYSDPGAEKMHGFPGHPEASLNGGLMAIQEKD